MPSRRTFLQQTTLLAGGAGLSPLLAGAVDDHYALLRSMRPAIDPMHPWEDESFWAQIRLAFTTSPNIVNLNNGGVSPQPLVVQQAHIRYYQLCNEGPSFYMWRTLDQGREPLRARLASLAGCLPEEIAINRNSTEGLNSVIFGLNLKAGDEVVLSRYDYPNMMNAWKQREKRDGIKLNWVDLDLPSSSEDDLADRYIGAISPRTRVVHITHMINWTGQIMPVRKIAGAAHARGCEVIVDGAHSFAHFQHSIPDTGADYYATSLHKWLCAPFGSGMLYIRKEKIPAVWALLSNDQPDGPDIRKFETLGTRSFASEMAIGQAIDFHEMVGAGLKEQRLRYLKDYWTTRASALPGLSLVTPSLPAFSCGIAHFRVEGWTGAQIEQFLFDKYKIHTVAIQFEKLNGVRVTPHLYTSLSDLDRLLEGLAEITRSSPPKK